VRRVQEDEHARVAREDDGEMPTMDVVQAGSSPRTGKDGVSLIAIPFQDCDEDIDTEGRYG